MKVTREQAYDILELPVDAAETEVKKSFKRLALQYHPDKNGGCQNSTEKFKLVSAAYARLTSKDQDDDDLNDFSTAFSEQLFDELFGGNNAMPFAFFMQDLFGCMRKHEMRSRGPRVKIQRPRGAHMSTGVPHARGGGVPHARRGGMPPLSGDFMRAMFGMDLGASDEESSSEWETDEEGVAPGQEGTSGQQDEHSDSETDSGSSEWETVDGSEDGDASSAEQGETAAGAAREEHAGQSGCSPVASS